MTIDFELKAAARYCTTCPKCGQTRKKQGTKSLSVFRDGDGFVRVKCHHSADCEYGTMKQFKDPEPGVAFIATTVSQEDIIIPIEGSIELPETWQDGLVYWYRDVLNRPLFGVIRYPSKAFAPLVLLKTGEWRGGAGAKYPTGQVLFGAEQLAGKTKVLIVEGEKAALAGQKLYEGKDIAVVSWRGGANNIANGAWGLLKGKKEIYLWPDNDTAGIAAMNEIVKLLPGSTIKMLSVSHLPPKSDIADAISKEDFIRCFQEATIIESNSAKSPMSWDQIQSQNEFLNKSKPTGFDVIDKAIQLPPSGVVVIEGRTGHGKTALAVNLGDNFLKMGHRVVVFSYEMPGSRLCGRFVRRSNPSLSSSEAVAGSSTPQYILEAINSGQLEVYDQSAQLKAEDLLSLLDSAEYNGALVIIDNLQIIPITSSRFNTQEAIKEQIMDPLRVVANNHGFIVVALSQVTPNLITPELDAPRGCKDIHMAAEMVLRVWSKDDFATHPVYDHLKGNFAVHVIKSRDGESNIVFDCDFHMGAVIIPTHLLTPKEVGQMLKNARIGRTKAAKGDIDAF